MFSQMQMQYIASAVDKMKIEPASLSLFSKTLNSLHPGLEMGTARFNPGDNPVID